MSFCKAPTSSNSSNECEEHVRWRHQKTNTASVAAVLRWWVAVDAAADSDEQHVRSVDHLAVFRTQEKTLLPGWGIVKGANFERNALTKLITVLD